MTFQSARTIKNPRKPHRCDYCGSKIPKRVSHYKEAGVWEGDFYTIRGHHDCRALWLDVFSIYGDPYDGMPLDLCEVIAGDEGREIVQAEYNLWRGHYPHAICRLELRWQRGDIAGRERYCAAGLEPDPEDYPEVFG